MDTPDTTACLWTPLHLELMLHYNFSPEPAENFLAPAQQCYLGELVQHGLLYEMYENEKAGSYSVTGKGRAFVDRLCRTPLPVRVTKLKQVVVEAWE